MSCQGQTRPVFIAIHVPPHRYCDGCNRLYTIEGDFMLPCNEAKHLKQFEPLRSHSYIVKSA